MGEVPDIRLFPGMLGMLAHAGFIDDAVKLAATWGGTSHYIPSKPTENCEICKVISLKAALMLAEYYSGPHDIPLLAGLGKKKLALLSVNHLAPTDAARAVGCTARYVRKVRNKGA